MHLTIVGLVILLFGLILWASVGPTPANTFNKQCEKHGGIPQPYHICLKPDSIIDFDNTYKK